MNLVLKYSYLPTIKAKYGFNQNRIYAIIYQFAFLFLFSLIFYQLRIGRPTNLQE